MAQGVRGLIRPVVWSVDYEEYRASYEENTTLVNKLTSYKK